MKKKGFLHNTFIMFAAMFITKLLGALLKIPLGNILGGEGMGYFTTAYSIFTPVLAFTCSGIPTIVTQATAAYSSQGRYRDIFRFRKSALLLGALVGLAGTAIILITAAPFAYFIANSPGSLPSILIIAPTVFACSVTAVYRGYYEGMSDMAPTAASQIIEAAVKAAGGVGLSYYVYIKGAEYFGSAEKALPYAAAAAIFSVMISEFCGTVYIVHKAKKDTLEERRLYGKMKISDCLDIMKDIFARSLPLALGAAASNLISFSDMLTVSNCINLSRNMFPEAFGSGKILPEVLSAEPADLGNFLYGSYSGLVLSVYMLTAAVSGVISRCSLPKLTCAVETNDRENTERCVKMLLKGTAFICIPVSLLMTVLSEPILTVLYPFRHAEVSAGVLPLQILSLGGLAGSLGGALFTLFNAYGDFRTPVKLTLYSGAVKLVLNAALIIIPQVNIAGAALATSISGLFCTVCAYFSLKKQYGLSIPLLSASFAPLISGSVSAMCVFCAYQTAVSRKGRIESLIFALLTGAFIYIFLLFIADSRELGEIIRSLRRKNPEKSCK